MKETRVQKWKAYRDSLIKQEAKIEENDNEIRDIEVKSTPKQSQSKMSATSTLPYTEVIKGVESEEQSASNNKSTKSFILLTIIAAVLGVAVITGLVFLGIWAFGGQ